MQDEGRPHLREFVQITEIDSDTALEHEGARITAALVEHPPIRHAFAYRIDQAGASICFSGDTSPSPALAALAQGADLLVHETTYLANAADFLPPARAAQVLARMRAVHSDPAGAAGIASSSGAGALLLSPVGAFGPVADEEILDEASASFSGPVWVGRDLLRVPLPVRGDI
jgi:ribonuclease BN (tRNA processing enzyme)